VGALILSLTLLCAQLALGAPPALADFATAFRAYSEGHYEQAHAEFLQLAQFGHAASQYDLGAMALQGQGTPKDLGAAVGWLTAAAENGDTQLPPEKLAAVRATLNDEQRKAADEIEARYGRAGLMQTVLPVPPPGAHCRNVVPAQVSHKITSDSNYYPSGGRWRDQNGFVILQLTIGVDGVPRDPEILMSVPNPDFSAAALDVWMPSRWVPAKRDGVPVESKVEGKVIFSMAGGVLWDLPALKAIREKALTGDPTAQYQIGLAATLDPTLGIPPRQAYSLLVSAAQGGHPRAQSWAANRFMSIEGCGGSDRKKLPWLHAAASAGDGPAQVALALDLLSGQPSDEQVTEARQLLEQAARSDDTYALKHVAALLAASPLAALRDPATAKSVADRLAKSPIESDPQMYEAAALAYAASGDYSDARAKEQRAIKKALQLGWDTQQMQERFALYSRGKPWSGDLFAETSGGAQQPTTPAQ
jgi:TPR repeat protein